MINDSIAICKTMDNPVKLSWENLNYEVEVLGKDKEDTKKLKVIKNVSGYAMPG